MIQGLYSAANGMLTVENRQAVTANNIANAATSGFKRQLAVQQGYYASHDANGSHPQILSSLPAPGGGLKLMETFGDFSDGVLTTTGNPLDVALTGPGFLQVETPNGQRFTRHGQLTAGPNGQLMTTDGFPVLGTNGAPIDVGGGMPQIDGTGAVVVNGQNRGQLAITEFENPQLLSRAGFTLYSASEEAMETAAPADNTIVTSGALEQANVQIPVELNNMMLAMRAYQANERVITSIDETASRLIDQVGVPS